LPLGRQLTKPVSLTRSHASASDTALVVVIAIWREICRVNADTAFLGEIFTFAMTDRDSFGVASRINNKLERVKFPIEDIEYTRRRSTTLAASSKRNVRI
jgi:hypothetical protein